MYPAEYYSKDFYRKNKHILFKKIKKFQHYFGLKKTRTKHTQTKNVEFNQKIMLTFHRSEFSTFSTGFLTKWSAKPWKTVWKKLKKPLKINIFPVQNQLQVQNLQCWKVFIIRKTIYFCKTDSFTFLRHIKIW